MCDSDACTGFASFALLGGFSVNSVSPVTCPSSSIKSVVAESRRIETNLDLTTKTIHFP